MRLEGRRRGAAKQKMRTCWAVHNGMRECAGGQDSRLEAGGMRGRYEIQRYYVGQWGVVAVRGSAVAAAGVAGRHGLVVVGRVRGAWGARRGQVGLRSGGKCRRGILHHTAWRI